jgi:hypothetical protein
VGILAIISGVKISSDDLIKSGGSDRIHFLDLELGGQGASPVADEIEKICLARLIQGGIDDYFLARDVEADILGLVKLLPERGALGVIGRSGFINLYDWIKTEPQNAALAAFPSDRAFAMVMQKQLFSDWKIVSTKNSMPKYTRVPDKLIPGYWFRHRDFVQEICKETLLP